MQDMTAGVEPIGDAELEVRQRRAQELMREAGIDALYLDTSPNLFYFTGLDLKPSERLHGAVLPAEGPVVYLSPAFEEPKTRSLLRLDGEIRVWEEHEDPAALVIDTVASFGADKGTIAVDPSAPFFVVDGMRRAGNRYELVNGATITAACRAEKTSAEIALLTAANAVTLEVHRAAARILREGITTTEVQAFVTEAHRRLGAKPPGGAPLVLFGEATAYPHGVGYPQTLQDGNMVLLDIGGFVGGYRSDMTRTYVFGEPTARQREILGSGAEGAGRRLCRGRAWRAMRGCRHRRAGRHRGVRTGAGLRAAGAAAPHRPWHRDRGPRGALHREGQHDAANPRHVLLDRAHDLHLRRVRHPAGGLRLHDGAGATVVHRACGER